MSNAIQSYPLAWKIYALALLAVGLVGCWYFVYRYAKTYRWWENETGRHLIAFSSSLGLFFLYYAVLSVFPDLPGKNVIRLVLFTWLVVVVVWRVVWFERIKRAEEREGRGVK